MKEKHMPNDINNQDVRPSAKLVEQAIAACNFQNCNHEFCAPADWVAIEEYSVRVGEHMIETERGYAWQGTVYKAGVAVFDVMNSGDGGANRYGIRLNVPGEIALFQAAAAFAFPTVRVEADDCAVGFLDLIAQAP